MSYHSASIARTFPQRIGIFIDVQNMFYSAKLLHQSKVDYGRLLREITGTRHLIRAIAYIVQKPDVNQSGFHEALSRFGYELKIKELKIRPDPEGRGGTTAKGSWDVGMTIDALNMAEKLDTVILVTGDGDYVPLIEALRARGCRVEVVSFERSTANELIRAADQYIPIQEAWIFKEKKFVEQAAPAPVGGNGLLGSTAPGQTNYEGLPRDEDLEADSAAMEAAEQEGPYGEEDAAEPQPPAPASRPSSRGRGEKRPDLGILARANLHSPRIGDPAPQERGRLIQG
ncbi:MAG: NYN domain-containing protein [Planctomycetota bacterium]|nr:NYN domain-containing protein [Planctomycetota bacterium]